MSSSHDASRNVPWVLLRISNQLFGVPATHVREMAEKGAATRLPQSPRHVIGLITLRGQIVPAIDLRRRLGMPSAEEERSAFLHELHEHETAHTALYKSLSMDPASELEGLQTPAEYCATTQWLESKKEDWTGRTAQVVKVEPAHHNLHAVLESVAAKSGEAAAARLSAMKNKEMAELERAFDGARERMAQAHPQIAVVLEWEGRLLAVAVDEVESIERLKNDAIEDLPLSSGDLQSDLTCRTGKRVRDDALVLILDLPGLFHAAPRQAEDEDPMELVTRRAA